MIERVSGYGDTHPLAGEKATAESNQRITLSLSLTPKAREDARSHPIASAAPPPPERPQQPL